jgi:hypothetical protein
MPIGWIRAYERELAELGFTNRNDEARNKRAEFRRDFRTQLRRAAAPDGEVIRALRWGDEVELPSGIASGDWTAAVFASDAGFVPTSDVVEVAYVRRHGEGEDGHKTTITYQSGEGAAAKTVKVALIWGDCVQIMRRDGASCYARARGVYGNVPSADVTDKPLLEVYFIDVGQGDGVLVRTPDRRHMLIDGGLERAKQQTGKNAADFTDWKFFSDYGDFEIRLASLMASHSDNDHYGGLHDLVRTNDAADRELDCVGARIDAFDHPGLSRWEDRPGAQPPHQDGLGPRERVNGVHYFVRLLGDRADAKEATTNGSANELSGPWRFFIRDVLENNPDARVRRLGVTREGLSSGAPLPDLWDDADGYAIKVLGPVTADRNGAPSLLDLGPASYNTNGHSICLRLDYGAASILLTGDLNKPSMDWLADCYGDRMGAWLCDVVKACHHGSHKISYRFLEAMRPAATVISSGDAEGHAHPRPEIVGASAITGRVEIDRDRDMLITPLVYMTEIERSVSLGAVDRLDYDGVPAGAEAATQLGSLLGRHFDDMNEQALLLPAELQQIADAPENERATLRNRLRQEARTKLRDQEIRTLKGTMRVGYSVTVPNGPVSSTFKRKAFWRSRVLDRNHYGLVNVRTDGKTIMCATLNETEEDWIIHTFPARTRPAPG